jgi:lysozyme
MSVSDERIFTMDELPPDDLELLSIAPDGAPADDAGATPGLPLESSRRPDLPDGMVEADRWKVELEHDEMFAAAAVQHCSVDGLHLIEGFEGYSGKRYLDAVGVPTIGYGTTSAVIFPLPKTCTRAQAEGWLRLYVQRNCEPAVRGMGVPLNQHQFDALCSFAYNLGPGSLSSGWSVGRLLRARQYRAAADAMLQFDHAGGVVLAGLARRRQTERSRFLTPMPAVQDPHHLERFPNSTFTIDGRRINERVTVGEFYRLLAHGAQSHNQLHRLQGDLVLLRKRLWAVAHFDHPPSWGRDWRGWRFQQLLHLTAVKI